MSSERTFNRDTTDVHQLRNILIAMTERLAFKLRKQQKLTACLTVKIRYSDFNTYTLQCRMPYTSCDHLLIAKAKELFDKLYQRRLLIRLIGVRFSHLVGGGYQISLLDDTEEMINLYQAMDRMRLRFGEDKIKRAAGMQVKHRSMNPFNGVST
jgi:DNA polymerase-4